MRNQQEIDELEEEKRRIEKEIRMAEEKIGDVAVEKMSDEQKEATNFMNKLQNDLDKTMSILKRSDFDMALRTDAAVEEEEEKTIKQQ